MTRVFNNPWIVNVLVLALLWMYMLCRSSIFCLFAGFFFFSASSLCDAAVLPASSHPFELRGVFFYGSHRSFSLHDTETGASWWLPVGAARGELVVRSYDDLQSTLLLDWRGEAVSLKMKNGLSAAHELALKYSSPAKSFDSLSEVNQRIYRQSDQLIRLARSASTGRVVRDQAKVQELRAFISTDPSATELLNFVPTLGDSVDYEEFLKIDFPKVMKSRNKQNTPGWGIDKSVGLEEIEAMIASGASESEMNQLLTDKK